jgi:hypothetical protein
MYFKELFPWTFGGEDLPSPPPPINSEGKKCTLKGRAYCCCANSSTLNMHIIFGVFPLWRGVIMLRPGVRGSLADSIFVQKKNTGPS